MNFFKILLYIGQGDKTVFECTVSEQRTYLASLGYPTDLFDRSYKQYCCHMYFVPMWKKVIMGVIAALIYPPILTYLLIKGCFYKHIFHIDTISDFTSMQEVIPNSIRESYTPDSSVWDNALGLRFADMPIVFSLLIRYIAHPYFVLKVTIKFALYRALIIRYSPEVLIVHNEYSFTSSALTEYCRRNNILHINVMHGEKLYYIRDSFFCFDYCYVWDRHYIELFCSLNAEPKQFVVAVPPSLAIDTQLYINSDSYADIKYYLAYHSEEDIASIVNSLKPAIEAGKTVKYRLHPRYGNKDILLKYCSEDEIEDAEQIPIQASVSNLKYAVGSYSTVLLQAWFSGKTVVLDDVTFPSTYDKLKSMHYMLAEKPHIRLSNLNMICK